MENFYVLPPTADTGAKLWKKIVYNGDDQVIEETICDYEIFNKGTLYDMPIKKFWEFKTGNVDIYHARDVDLIMSDQHLEQVYGYINQEYKLDAIQGAECSVFSLQEVNEQDHILFFSLQ